MSTLRRIPRFAAAVTLTLAALLSVVPSARALLYDLDFSTPPHTVGQPPVTGSGAAPRQTVSSVNHGNPTVVAAHGPMAVQPCRFNSVDGTGDQIELRLDDLPASNRYYLAADIVLTDAPVSPLAQFNVIFDAPTVRVIDFCGNGIVRLLDPNLGPLEFPGLLIGDVVRLEVEVDLDTDIWRVSLDGDLLHEGSFGPSTGIESVRFSTDVSQPLEPIRAGLDNVRIDTAFPSDQAACDRLTFGDLTLGTQYDAGDVFTSEGVLLTVVGYSQPIGPCGNPLDLGGFVQVVNDNGACGLGKELLFNNANVDFDFGDTVRELVIPYGEFGGTVSLSVNGDCVTAEDMVDLDGTALGGVAVSVFSEGQPGLSCGIVRLGGAVNQLAIGGQELYVDGLSYCQDCANLRRSAFDDQVNGTRFHVGDSFVSGAATHSFIHFFPPGTACTNPDPTGFAQIGNAGNACGSGREIWLNNINDLIDFGGPVDWLVLNYADLGGNVNVGVNGDCRNVENLSDLNGTTVGGAEFWAVDYGTPGQSCGTLYVVGLIESFGIGGQEFFIDNIRVCPNQTMDAGEPAVTATDATLLLAPARPNPARESSLLSFTLTRPAPVRITVYNVSGRAVRTLVNEERAAGAYQVAWDGRDANGRRVPAGIYAYRVETGTTVQSRTIILLD